MPGGCLDGFEGQRAASVSVGRSVSFGDAVVGHGEVPAADGVAGFCCAGVVGGGDGVGGTVAGGGAGEDDLGAVHAVGLPGRVEVDVESDEASSGGAGDLGAADPGAGSPQAEVELVVGALGVGGGEQPAVGDH